MMSLSILVAPDVPRDVNPKLSGEDSRSEEDNILLYEKLIYPQIDAFNKYIEQLETPQNSYYIFDTLDTIDKRSRLFNNLFVLSRLQKDSLILGDLIKISDSIKTKFNLSSDEMFDWYRTIRDCAERALKEDPNNKVFASYYNTYRDLCEKLSNKI